MKKLMYIAAVGEGPEQKNLGAPFSMSVTPGEVFEAEDDMATALLTIPQIKEVVVTSNGAIKPKVKKGKCKTCP